MISALGNWSAFFYEAVPALRCIFFLQKKDAALIGARANPFDKPLARIAAKILL